jgi:hypothetical protein
MCSFTKPCHFLRHAFQCQDTPARKTSQYLNTSTRGYGTFRCNLCYIYLKNVWSQSSWVFGILPGRFNFPIRPHSYNDFNLIPNSLGFGPGTMRVFWDLGHFKQSIFHCWNCLSIYFKKYFQVQFVVPLTIAIFSTDWQSPQPEWISHRHGGERPQVKNSIPPRYG